MKQSSIIISVIITGGILVAGLVIGLYVRDEGQRSNLDQSQYADKPQTKQDDITITDIQKGEDKKETGNLSSEQEAQLQEQLQIIKRQWVNMSEQERKDFRTALIQTIDVRRQDAESKIQTSPPEGRDSFQEEFMEIKTKWEDMTEQERQEFMEKMRENANAIRQGTD